MRLSLEERARELANQAYHVVIEVEALSDGTQVFFLSLAEIPGAQAHGETLEEALRELKEATYEYILSCLEDGIEVPEPYALSESTTGSDSIMIAVQYVDDDVITQARSIQYEHVLPVDLELHEESSFEWKQKSRALASA